jgi:hypothetical protein
MASLYILGNGFDLYHSMKISYFDFRDYVYQNNHKLYNYMEGVILCDNLWNDFENSIMKMRYDFIISI